MPSYIITIYRTTGGKETGHRYTQLENVDEVRAAVMEKLRKKPGFDTIAYILVTRTDMPATKLL
jgi:hypothetical protein